MTVQFQHRIVAYLLLMVAVLHAVQARATPHAGMAALLAVAVAVQAGIGIATLLMVVPLDVALTHQFGAVIVLWLAVVHLRRMRGAPPPVLTETAAAA